MKKIPPAHHHEGRCLVAPHPDLLKKMKAALSKARGARASAITRMLTLVRRKNSLLGRATAATPEGPPFSRAPA